MDKQSYTSEQLADLARWIKVICEPNRLLLLEKIIEGVQCNCELGDLLHMAPNLVSHHLGVLKESGLVNAGRYPLDARWSYYSINPVGMEKLNKMIGDFLNIDRLQPHPIHCGPRTDKDQSSTTV